MPAQEEGREIHAPAAVVGEGVEGVRGTVEDVKFALTTGLGQGEVHGQAVVPVDFVVSAAGLAHCTQRPSSGRKPVRSRRWRSNHRHTSAGGKPAAQPALKS